MTALNLSGFFAATLSKIKTWFDRCFECYIFECIHCDLNNIFSPENVLNSWILTIIEPVDHLFWTFCGLRSSECGYFKCTKSEKCTDRFAVFTQAVFMWINFDLIYHRRYKWISKKAQSEYSVLKIKKNKDNSNQERDKAMEYCEPMFKKHK